MVNREDLFGRVERLWKYKGFWCLAVASYKTGHRMGYVQLPPEHPWHGVGVHDKAPNARDRSNDEAVIEDVDIVSAFFTDGYLETVSGQVNVHGGLNFAGQRDDLGEVLENHDGIPPGWWVGFDTGHSSDLPDLDLMREGVPYPGMLEAYEKIYFGPDSWRMEQALNMRRWDADQVVQEVEKLVDQLYQVQVLTRMANELEALP